MEKSECWGFTDTAPKWLYDLPSSQDIARICAFHFFNRTKTQNFYKVFQKDN